MGSKKREFPEEDPAGCKVQPKAKRLRLPVLKNNNILDVLRMREITGKPIVYSFDVRRIEQKIDECYGLLPESRPVLQIRQQYSDYLKLLQVLNPILGQLHDLLCCLLNNIKRNGQMMVMVLYRDIYMKLDPLVYEVLNANYSNAKVVVKQEYELDILSEGFVHPFNNQNMEAVITTQTAKDLKIETTHFIEQHGQIVSSLKKLFAQHNPRVYLTPGAGVSQS